MNFLGRDSLPSGKQSDGLARGGAAAPSGGLHLQGRRVFGQGEGGGIGAQSPAGGQLALGGLGLGLCLGLQGLAAGFLGRQHLAEVGGGLERGEGIVGIALRGLVRTGAGFFLPILAGREGLVDGGRGGCGWSDDRGGLQVGLSGGKT